GTLSTAGTPVAGTHTWFLGTGRRKESVARVFLRAGSGKFTVNDRSVEQYFPNHAWKHEAIEPLKFTNLADQVDVVVDRKSTRLNSSHRTNSYAVFCLKKKKQSQRNPDPNRTTQD